jgi:hypothetical protein
MLAAAGVCAFTADRIADWFARRPVAVAVLVSIWIVLTTGLWIWLVVGPLVALFTLGERQVDVRLMRRSTLALRVSAPRRGSIRNGPIYAVAALVLFGIALPRPSPAMALAEALAILVLSLVIVVGWRLDYVVFRHEPDDANKTSEPLEIGQRCAARACGRLLTRDMVFEVAASNRPTQHVATIRDDEAAFHLPIRFRFAQVEVVNMPTASSAPSYGRPPRDSELVMVGREREIGLSLTRPNLKAFEMGTQKLVRTQRPAIRLDTVTGPVVLSFGSPGERAQAARAIRESLAS